MVMVTRKEIRITGGDYAKLRDHVLKHATREEAALLVAGCSTTDDAVILTVRDVILVPDGGFQTKEGLFLQIDPEFLAPVIKRCRHEPASLIMVHSHPFSHEGVAFSGIDDRGEEDLVPRLQARAPGRPHATMVFGRASVAARVWLPGADSSVAVDRIVVVGEREDIITPSNAPPPETARVDTTYGRQRLVLGDDAQQRLRNARVAVVGAGGLGSQVAVHLIHAGVRTLYVVDDDTLEESNRPRVLASQPGDVRDDLAKVDIVARYAAAVNPDVQVIPIRGSIEDAEVQRRLRDSEVFICCTDNLASRAALNRLAYQYLVPIVDIGMDVQLEGRAPGAVKNAAGRVMYVHPEGPCLECLQIVSHEALQREAGARPCADDEDKGIPPAPSAVFLNGTVAALAVTRWISTFSSIGRERVPRTFEMYLPTRGTVRSMAIGDLKPCGNCSDIRGFADDAPLPGAIAPPPAQD